MAEFCRGQEPKGLDTIAWCDGGRDAEGRCLGTVRAGVTFDEFRAAPEWARTYVVGNDDQWAGACPE